MNNDLRERVMWFMILSKWLGDELVEKFPALLQMLVM